MPTFETQVQTSWPAADAMAYLADMSRFEEWDPGTHAAEQVVGTGPEVGAEYDLDVGRTSMRYRIASLTPNRVQAVGKSRLLTSTDTVSVERTGGHTVVTYHAELGFNGPLSVFDLVLSPMFSRLGDKAAEGLADALDGTRLN